ncbi:RdgB/HAM1 family non-canonical purine NTP pyrophosphatase [Neolewinella persica]|uniref:RdgB/HAM1 family non-canonical purine NTP pyrophosphatase n=1 Tax=Neolewinella persica TaxID=70998 RepID=UPI000380011F|nr:RdgB/HAM1 family non-canonical purine NTP pyrophosphatase [Neolewinella persica]
MSPITKLVFATNNAHKIAEIKAQLGEAYDFQSLASIGCHEDVPETSPTLAGNAEQKARYVKEKYGYDCFSEDTGLEVDALNGAPGVITARYAGPARSAEANTAKIFAELSGKTDRTARFRTFICLVMNGEEHLFEGRCEGRISEEVRGGEGFGYDPIFIPAEGDGRTFAEMNGAEKRKYSHRARAMAKLSDFLRENAAS